MAHALPLPPVPSPLHIRVRLCESVRVRVEDGASEVGPCRDGGGGL